MKHFDHSYRDSPSWVSLTLIAYLAAGCLEPVPLTPTGMGDEAEFDTGDPREQGQLEDVAAPTLATDGSDRSGEGMYSGHAEIARRACS